MLGPVPAPAGHFQQQVEQLPAQVFDICSTRLTSAATGEALALNPGMLVTAEIHQGRRSVMEYLLSPIRKIEQEAARER